MPQQRNLLVFKSATHEAGCLLCSLCRCLQRYGRLYHLLFPLNLVSLFSLPCRSLAAVAKYAVSILVRSSNPPPRGRTVTILRAEVVHWSDSSAVYTVSKCNSIAVCRARSRFSPESCCMEETLTSSQKDWSTAFCLARWHGFPLRTVA